MFRKVNPALAVSKSIRVVVASLPEPLKHAETIKNISFCYSKTWPPTRFLIFCYVAFYFTCTARPGCTFEQPGLKSYCFCCFRIIFFVFWSRAELLFCFMGAGVHTFAALKVSDRQLVVKRDRQGDFSYPPLVRFRSIFCNFFVFWWIKGFCEKWTPA